MTIAQTIITAQEYAKLGAVEAACRILRNRMATAKRGSDQMKLDMARMAILDAAVDATVARANAAR
jgi:hypothetical protein